MYSSKLNKILLILLIMTIIAVFIMGYFLYSDNIEKNEFIAKNENLKNEIKRLEYK